MLHDFGAATSDPRFTRDGQACTGIGGYMDYVAKLKALGLTDDEIAAL